MKIRLLTFFLLFSLLSGIIIAKTSINKGYEIKKKDQRNIIVLGKSIIVNCNVEHFLIKIGGTVNINGKVGKDVVAVFADVRIGKNAEIDGDLIVISGKLFREEGSKVKGAIHNVSFSLKKINSSVEFFTVDSNTLALMKMIFSIISLIIALFVFAVFPNKITFAVEIFEENKLKIVLYGILGLLLSIILFISFVILSFIVIGIPLLIIQMIFIIFMIIFGRIVLYYYFGKLLTELIKIDIYSPGIYLLIGSFIYLLLYFIPIIGSIILKLLVIIEFGVGIGYLFRKWLKLKTLTEFINNYNGN